ncbi:3D domain-containing protein [Oribacterium sp. WCC10]|uniref:3D domain-containing protein n=1 Tax=Oribacterium sp. WCC10 TaxID=1855343 RepID=UPI0008E06855|nr:3D domain-containing protein [Oribacterium sp. WCC10]SFG39080.1 3D domain-containing protein [Oribacterium sp. WCC10]
MKSAELKTIAAAFIMAVVVSASAFAAEGVGPTGTAWNDTSQVTGYTLEESSDESLDAEMQAELALEQAMAAALAARPGETPIGTKVTEESTHYVRGACLGKFKLTGYYGAGVTYSGAYTVADHTIAADTSVLPLGTKVFINNTVYTVEDIGSGVVGNMIDIYYDTYGEAAGVTNLGYRYLDVYIAVPAT